MTGKENDSTLTEAELHIASLLDRLIAASATQTTEVCHFEMGAETGMEKLVYRDGFCPSRNVCNTKFNRCKQMKCKIFES